MPRFESKNAQDLLSHQACSSTISVSITLSQEGSVFSHGEKEYVSGKQNALHPARRASIGLGKAAFIDAEIASEWDVSETKALESGFRLFPDVKRRSPLHRLPNLWQTLTFVLIGGHHHLVTL